jgi:hypothetical protein
VSPFQSGFVKGKGTVNNSSKIETVVDKFCKAKKRLYYWCFVDFEKAFRRVNSEISRFKVRKLEIIEKEVSSIKKLCNKAQNVI